MSKKSLTYLFIILSSFSWSSYAYAGMDLIETVLMSATGVLQKASEVVEKVSTTIADVSSGKIFDEYYQDYIQVKGKIEQAQQRMKDLQERTERLANMNKKGNEVNSQEMAKYEEEVANTKAQVERSRQALLARGRINQEDLEAEDKDDEDDSEGLESKIIKTTDTKSAILSANTQNSKSNISPTLSGFENADISSINNRRFVSSDEETREKNDVKK